MFLLDPATAGVVRQAYPTIDGVRACELSLEQVVVPTDALLGEVGAALPAMRYQ